MNINYYIYMFKVAIVILLRLIILFVSLNLKNLHIQKIPTFFKESHSNSQDNLKISQTWQKSGSCPKGTIPIRRILKKDLLRAASLNRFGIKPVALLNNSTNTSNFNGSLEAITNSHSVYFMLNIEFKYSYIRAQ